MPSLSLYKRMKVGDRWKYERIADGSVPDVTMV